MHVLGIGAFMRNTVRCSVALPIAMLWFSGGAKMGAVAGRRPPATGLSPKHSGSLARECAPSPFVVLPCAPAPTMSGGAGDGWDDLLDEAEDQASSAAAEAEHAADSSSSGLSQEVGPIGIVATDPGGNEAGWEALLEEAICDATDSPASAAAGEMQPEQAILAMPESGLEHRDVPSHAPTPTQALALVRNFLAAPGRGADEAAIGRVCVMVGSLPSDARSKRVVLFDKDTEPNVKTIASTGRLRSAIATAEELGTTHKKVQTVRLRLGAAVVHVERFSVVRMLSEVTEAIPRRGASCSASALACATTRPLCVSRGGSLTMSAAPRPMRSPTFKARIWRTPPWRPHGPRLCSLSRADRCCSS